MPTARNIRAEDTKIGARIRMMRKANNISQSELASHLGVTFQQIQKYENGRNRVSGSSLIVLSKALKTSPEHLLGGKTDGQSPALLTIASEMPVTRLLLALSKLSTRQRRAVICNALADLVDSVV